MYLYWVHSVNVKISYGKISYGKINYKYGDNGELISLLLYWLKKNKITNLGANIYLQ